MLYRGYREGKVSEYEFANYILRSAFFKRYGRYPYRVSENFEGEIDYLIAILHLDTIPVHPDSLIAFDLADYAPPTPPCAADSIIGEWKIDKEPFYFGTARLPSQKVQIVTCGNHYFYLEENNDFPPNELFLVSRKDGCYIFRHQSGYKNERYLITAAGDLEILDADGELIYRYKK